MPLRLLIPIRLWFRHWRTAAAVSAALGLALGVNLAVYALLSALLLQPPPYPEPGRLVVTTAPISPTELQTWRKNSHTLETIAGYTREPVTLVSGNMALRIRAARVSPSLFTMLHVAPDAGRGFRDEEEADETIAMIGAGTARRLFGSAPAAIGQQLHIDGAPLTIVGTLPAWFQFPEKGVELWRPLGRQRRIVRLPGGRTTVSVAAFPALARLRAGMTVEQARSETSALFSDTRATDDLTLVGLQQARTRAVRKPLLLLQLSVLVILGLGAANVVLMMFVHYSGRRREFTIRAALGATSRRVNADVLLECLLLALPVFLVATAVGQLSFSLLRAAIGGDVVRPRIDTATIALAGIVTIALVVVTALTSAAFITRRRDALDVRTQDSPPDTRRSRHVVLAVQLAFCSALLLVATSTVKSVRIAAADRPVFASSDLLAGEVHLVGPRYVKFESRSVFVERLLSSLKTRGITANATIVSALPFGEASDTGHLSPPGKARTTVAYSPDGTATQYAHAGPEFFHVMRWPILRGRDLAWTDTERSEPVTVITQAMAVDKFGSEAALGRSLLFGGRAWRVVGVVAAHRPAPGLASQPTAYVSFKQLGEAGRELALRSMVLIVPNDGLATDLTARVAGVISDLDPSVALSKVATLDVQFAESMVFLRFFGVLLAILAALAVGVGTFGLYAMVAGLVEERTREMAVRMALGADGRQLFSMVTRDSLMMVGVGLLLATPGAVILHGLLRSAVPGIQPLSAMTAALVALMMLAVGAVAAFVPALRAARVDPAASLRA